MTFEPSALGADHASRLRLFIETHIEPNDAVYAEQYRSNLAAGTPHLVPQIVQDLKPVAREAGLWNLFHPELGPGLSNLDYAFLAEQMGAWGWASEVFNCSAPDTGNMEILHMFGTAEQKERWLQPLLDGQIRSGFAMTEPAVASSDATNIESSIVRDGDHYVINGTKWWTTGAADPRCAVLIFMGKTDPEAPVHLQQSMVLVPLDTPGVEVVRNLPVFGYVDQHGHCEVRFTDVRVPVDHVLGHEGGGFAIAQARLGPGRIHHCMRVIGVAERALALMCRRAIDRVAFGKPLAAQGVVREWIADSRIEIEQARLLTLKAAHLIDTVGAKGAAVEISAIKVVAPNVALAVVDRAIQTHGGAGVSDDTPLARMWAGLRTLRFADGPDEVHRRQVARRELARHGG